MIRFLFVVPLVVMAASSSMTPRAWAQGAGPHEHDACARDVSRFCRAHMNDGDSVVLSCLQQNRARLSKACAKVLTDHGQ
jgi:Cysteine rich repeat